MALRCLLFSSDEGTAEPICQVLAGLGVEGEYCPDAVAAVEKVTNQSFQVVIIDWDKQPEAGFLLTTARERKASERPLTLAIVSDDASVPKALQAGANSILRKPLILNQVKDTLTTARDLLRAKFESAAQAAAAGASSGSAAGLPSSGSNSEATLRAGEFLNTAGTAPGTQLDTESAFHMAQDQAASHEIDPLKDLEPMAAAVANSKPDPAPPRPPDEPRGLQWYLNSRVAQAPAPAHAFPPTPPVSEKPELLGFDQTPTPSTERPADHPVHEAAPPAHDEQEQKAEAKLFAYMDGQVGAQEPQKKSRPRFQLGKGPILAAAALAACAVVAAPQAPWHPALKSLFRRGQQVTHAWLNPQPVTPQQAPESHENFGRPGDEYKLPVAENIPDATTDPSQIRVVPVVDPTIKKPNNAGANAAAADPATVNTSPTDQPAGPDQPQTDVNQPADGSATGVTAQPIGSANAATSAAASTAAGSSNTVAAADPPHPDPSAASTLLEPPSTQPPPPRNPPHTTQSVVNVPSSLKSQMASMTPEASGNKAPEAALPSIEPVAVTEVAERALLADQPAIAYPANAKGQQGTVVLQVLIGRDGTVQDAKFIQGSLAFARPAIDGVKQWKFKPYMMNGRPVSVQTTLTMAFKPGA